ncbi:MAG: hypothetical protein IPK22_19710 [Verrucomicrobiaceae bacterium]|nr:hypothetical protein [Verrucomicrobiaceae bacterium]
MQRLASLDVFRGIVMFLLGLRLLELDEVALHFPGSAVWQFIGFHSSHVPWVGCSLNDLIHPSFAFLTGASLVFSVSSRSSKGDSKLKMTLHALWRSLALIFLGICLRSQTREMTNWTFEETLTQTGLGYMVVFALAFAGSKWRWSCFAGFLMLHWIIYVWHPVMPPHANPSDWNIPEGWSHDFGGFYAHWNHNRNAGWALDIWLLNLFPRPSAYVGYLGGYATINFISTISTMILGLVAGSWLKDREKAAKRLSVAGLICLPVSLAMHFGGVCPIVKHLWTPSWVFWSGGCCLLVLAALFQLVDVKQHRRWAWLFIVIGMNSLAFYVMRHTLDLWLAETLEIHLGKGFLLRLGPEMETIMTGVPSLLFLLLVVVWMDRRKLYLRL